MAPLSSQRAQYVAALEHDWDALVRDLACLPAAHKVILFGSYAAGRRDLFTDLDLLVVMDSDLDFVARNVELARQIRATVTLDLLAYTPEEIARLHDRPFIRQALQTGVLLYEKESS